jgi:hypothetical protein
MDTVTSFSLTPGTSTVSTSSSFVSCMSTAGRHERVAGAATATGRPRKERWSPFGSSDRWEPFRNVSDIQGEVNRLFDTIAIAEPSLESCHPLGPARSILSTHVIYHLSD